MSGRPLNALRILPAALLRRLGVQFDIELPDLASLRSLYARAHSVGPSATGLRDPWVPLVSDHQRRALVRVLRDEVLRRADREQLSVHVREWLYEHQVIIVHDRVIRSLEATALAELEGDTAPRTARTAASPRCTSSVVVMKLQPHRTRGHTTRRGSWWCTAAVPSSSNRPSSP